MRAVLVVLALGAVASAADKPRWQTCPLPPAMPESSTHGTVASDGAQIYYATYGDPTGAPVILLHGGLGNSDHWANQLPALVDAKLQIIAIDSRGQGRSTRTRAAVTYDTMAKDVLAVMDELKLDKASLVGWSDGGEIALKLAISNPARVDKLFVFGTNYSSAGSKPRNNQRSETFSAYAVKCKTDYVKLAKKTSRQYDELVDWLLPIWRNPMGFTKDQLKSITAPTIVADGDHDEVIVLDQVEEMSKLIPNGKLAVIKDASHFALWQAPAEFNKVLVEFLKS